MLLATHSIMEVKIKMKTTGRIAYMCTCILLCFILYRFESSVSALEVEGMAQGKIPRLLSSQTVHSENHTSLFTLMFETNPLDESADQKLRAESQALEIVYDAVSKKSYFGSTEKSSTV